MNDNCGMAVRHPRPAQCQGAHAVRAVRYGPMVHVREPLVDQFGEGTEFGVRLCFPQFGKLIQPHGEQGAAERDQLAGFQQGGGRHRFAGLDVDHHPHLVDGDIRPRPPQDGDPLDRVHSELRKMGRKKSGDFALRSSGCPFHGSSFRIVSNGFLSTGSPQSSTGGDAWWGWLSASLAEALRSR